MRFPEHYRSFLLDVSGGGPGPGYGLFRFDRSDLDDQLNGTGWSAFGATTEFYRTAFPHTRAVAIPEDLVTEDPAVFDRNVVGSWLLADYGCAIQVQHQVRFALDVMGLIGQARRRDVADAGDG